jgi:uncharacterized membrane protein SirB2
MYLIIKNVHIFCVTLTFILFIMSRVWMIQESHWLQHWNFQIVPHLIDTVLLLNGVALVFVIHQYPGTHNWLTAKLLALLFYIVVGSIALKRGKTKTIRIIAWIAALTVFLYLVMVALTRLANPLAW